MTGALYLTDGTTRINLYTGIDGFNLDRWDPSIAAAKDTWRESPLSDGRKLAMSKWANAIETMSFVVSRFIQDDVIADTQELRRLLEQAKQYFIGGSDVPVWLEARGTCETNTRYATICNYSTSNDSDPYHKPFDLDHPAMSPWTLVLERQHWRDQPPGSSTCIQLSATQDYYDASDDDFVPTESADDCYVEHLAGVINLNNAFMYFGAGAAGATYGSGTRFRSVNIPQGAMILNSYIKFESNAAYAVDNCNVIISGDDTDNSAIFSTYADYIGRALTTAHIHWDIIAHWVAGTYYQTSDISTVIQEIVSRVGWVSGNALSIIIDNNGSSVNALRGPVSWNHAAVRYEPHLYVWWFDSTTRTFGRTATCNDEVYVANKHNKAQLTHIFIDDGGVFSANLVGAGLPFALLPAVPAVWDLIEFGITNAIPNSGPFCSLVFDLSVAQTDLTTIVWQYWNGAWVNLTVQDNTNQDGFMIGVAFNTTGVNSVHWEQPGDWIPLIINGVSAYWVRAMVTAIGGAPTPPIQVNRDIYTIVTPYVDTLAAQVPGDIPALARQLLYGESCHYNLGSMAINNICAGLRSYDRGADFTAYLNLADEQLSPNTSVTVNGGTSTIIVDPYSPTGKSMQFTTGGAAARAWLGYITILTPTSVHFAGKFRCFARATNLITPANGIYWLMLAQYSYLNYQWVSNPLGFAPNEYILDFGMITIPTSLYDIGDTYQSIILRIDGQALGAITAAISDIIIIPADECFIETGSPMVGGGYIAETRLGFLVQHRSLDIDSTIPRRFMTSKLQQTTPTYRLSSWTNHNTTPLIYQPNERQRWWFTFQRRLTSTIDPEVSLAVSAQSWKVSRYLSMRGNR